MAILETRSRQAGNLVLLACLTLSAGTAPVFAADVSQVRETIAQLSATMSGDELAAIYQAIGELPKADQEELRQALHAKLDELFDPEHHPAEPPVGPVAAQADETPTAAPAETGDEFFAELNRRTAATRLRLRIEELQLGQNATADALRQRDDLVIEISQLADPMTRDELLQHLADREQAADQAIQPTVDHE